jgi:hypothetical protein
MEKSMAVRSEKPRMWTTPYEVVETLAFALVNGVLAVLALVFAALVLGCLS